MLVLISRNPSKFENFFLSRMLMTITSPAQSYLLTVSNTVRDTFSKYLLLIDTFDENKKLKRTIDLQNVHLATLDQVRQENFRLRKLLDLKAHIQYPILLAKIIGNDPSQSLHILRIDKGSAHGVSFGMPVVTADGAVGYIYRVIDNYSDVLLLTDSNSNISSILQRNRVRGVVEGSGAKNPLRLKYVGKREDILVGDIIVTSNFGESGIFPQGFPIGTISHIQPLSTSIMKQIFVKPSVDFSKIEEVFVLLKTNKYFSNFRTGQTKVQGTKQ